MYIIYNTYNFFNKIMKWKFTLAGGFCAVLPLLLSSFVSEMIVYPNHQNQRLYLKSSRRKLTHINILHN